MRRTSAALAAALAFATVATGCSTKSGTSGSGSSGTQSGTPSSAAAGQSGQGVTATSIRLGITYPDLAALRSTLNIDAGDYQAAFTALINDVNSHGGVNGRKIVPYFAPVNPIGTAPAAAACTKLTEDNKVFAVIGFFQADDPPCYVTTHSVPIVGASLTDKQDQAAKATWFNTLLTGEHLLPKQMSVLKAEGVFDGHKVAVVGQNGDQAGIDLVLPELKKLGVDVVQSAINDAPAGDTNAGYAQYGLIAQKFQSSGADVVIAVGAAGGGWPRALQVNRSNYTPRLVATTYSALQSYTSDKAGIEAKIIKNAISATNTPSAATVWNDPAIQRCVALIRKAYPKVNINNPLTATSKTPVTWNAPESSCQLTATFVAIAKAAGATLNNSTFLKGGESLTNVVLPGTGGPLHFGPGHHDGDGPLFVYTWNSATQKFDAKAVTS